MMMMMIIYKMKSKTGSMMMMMMMMMMIIYKMKSKTGSMMMMMMMTTTTMMIIIIGLLSILAYISQHSDDRTICEGCVCMSCSLHVYAKVIATWPGLVIVAVLAVVAACGIASFPGVGFQVTTFPDFSEDPIEVSAV